MYLTAISSQTTSKKVDNKMSNVKDQIVVISNGEAFSKFFWNLFYDEELTSNAMVLLMWYLRVTTNGRNTCWQSVRYIADHTPIGINGVKPARDLLVRLGYIQAQQRADKGYNIVIDMDVLSVRNINWWIEQSKKPLEGVSRKCDRNDELSQNSDIDCHENVIDPSQNRDQSNSLLSERQKSLHDENSNEFSVEQVLTSSTAFTSDNSSSRTGSKPVRQDDVCSTQIPFGETDVSQGTNSKAKVEDTRIIVDDCPKGDIIHVIKGALIKARGNQKRGLTTISVKDYNKLHAEIQLKGGRRMESMQRQYEIHDTKIRKYIEEELEEGTKAIRKPISYHGMIHRLLLVEIHTFGLLEWMLEKYKTQPEILTDAQSIRQENGTSLKASISPQGSLFAQYVDTPYLDDRDQ